MTNLNEEHVGFGNVGRRDVTHIDCSNSYIFAASIVKDGSSSGVGAAGEESPGKDKYRRKGKGSEAVRQLIAGAGAGAITKTATAPLERMKILFQLQAMKADAAGSAGAVKKTDLKYKSVTDAVRILYREEGFLSFWKGNGANVLRVIPVYSLKFGLNDQIRDLVRTHPGQKLGFWQKMASGVTAGTITTFATYPLETVRTRLAMGSGLGVKYKGIIDVMQDTMKKEGFLAFYKGLLPTFLSGPLYVGLQMTFYDVYRDMIDNWLAQRKKAQGSGANETNKGGMLVAMQTTGKQLTAGALSGVTAQTIAYPGDTVRRRMQTDGMGGAKRVYRGMMDCCRVIMRKEGIMGFYSGVGTNVFRALPGN